MSSIFASSEFKLLLCSVSKIFWSYAACFKILYASTFYSSCIIQLKKINVQVTFLKLFLPLKIIIKILNILYKQGQDFIYGEHFKIY